ncbi:hypothetical protein [Phenylobacterium sp.]|uniref:hypothetical protein n=1 Tax=Phenylobacterium sp. TaxID=1871053 RepID=UPI002731DDEE|nr:hypothetical protein [Phenylobacterium sp.]MDP1873183.1 hypothetical protein [Phenylobacterium sp.]
MTHDPIRLSFKIDAFQPDQIPMARLAEYMSDIAMMIGEKANVHFVRLEDGCTQILHDVEYTAYPKIEARLASVRDGTAPAEAMNAYRGLNKKLAIDNTFARYTVAANDADFGLDFPGIEAPKPVEIALVEQPGFITGTVQGIGGKTISEKGVSVFVDTGDTVHACSAPIAVARDLGAFILREPRRLEGFAGWQRDENGTWTLKRFTIQGHFPLERATLGELIEQFRAVPSDLSEIRDPWGALMADRNQEGGEH